MEKKYIADEPEKYARLIEEWHPTKNGTLTPNNVSAGSGKYLIWWKCRDKGHEWEAKPANRKQVGSGCPVCSGRLLVVGINDLGSLHPELSKQWHPTLNNDINPFGVLSQSGKSAWWLCPVGEDHVWKSPIADRTRGSRCPYCANRKILPGFNDLGSSEKYAHVAAEWNYQKNEIDINGVSPTSNLKAWWKCINGHEWEAIVHYRTFSQSANCKKCLPRRRTNKPEPEKFLTDIELLVKEWHPENERNISDIKAGSSYKALWICSKDSRHIWRSTVRNRTKGAKCLVCSGRLIIPGVNDIASMPEHQHLVREWHPDNDRSPSEVGIDTVYQVKWKCQKGHIWEVRLSNRTKRKNGCPECAKRDPWSGTKKSIVDFPELLKYWHPDNKADPATVPFQSRTTHTWRCDQNPLHVWDGTVDSRKKGTALCPVCSGSIVILGVNDLASMAEHQTMLLDWHPDNTFGPESVTVSSSRIVLWKCPTSPEHSPWLMSVSSRTNKFSPSGCPKCSNRISKGEIEVFDIVETLRFDVRQSVRSMIPRGELDIYVPESNFAIEYNGIYWHSEAMKSNKRYHVEKLAKCRIAGVELYTVWEDDWRLRRDIVIRDIAHRLGVTEDIHKVLPNAPLHFAEHVKASDLEVCEISLDDADIFLAENHIEGSSHGSNAFGLFDDNDRLRAVMTISKTSNEGEFVISRYAMTGEVENGFETLMAMVEAVKEAQTLIASVDLSHSEGDEYLQFGFVLEEELPEGHSYFYRNERHNPDSLIRNLIEAEPSLSGKSEQEIAIAKSLIRIWDYGTKRYRKELTK